MKHGLILAKIALIFKATEKFLANAVSLKGAARGKVEEWHTFAAGCLGKQKRRRHHCRWQGMWGLWHVGALVNPRLV